MATLPDLGPSGCKVHPAHGYSNPHWASTEMAPPTFPSFLPRGAVRRSFSQIDIQVENARRAAWTARGHAMNGTMLTAGGCLGYAGYQPQARLSGKQSDPQPASLRRR